MSVTCVFGMHWGDEGKGRIVDLLAAQSDVVVRFQGGANAGHTVIVDDQKYVLHLLPSGVIQPSTINVIGNGVVVDPEVVLAEIDELVGRGIKLDGRLFISDRAHVVLPHHKLLDRAFEALRGDGALGTTFRGIGPAYSDKASRDGVRIVDLLETKRFAPALTMAKRYGDPILEKVGMDPIDVDASAKQLSAWGKRLRPFVRDTVSFLLDQQEKGVRILLEGAQGYALDIDHGTYPFVTSSSTCPAGAAAGTGLPPRAIDEMVGVVKAYSTRVGAGPFPTAAEPSVAEHLGKHGAEFGATTGRPRGCGWFDGVIAKRAIETQGVDSVCLMKMDVLSGLTEIKVCTAYTYQGETLTAPPAWIGDWDDLKPVYTTYDGWNEDISGVRHFIDLPVAAQHYVHAIESFLNTPISIVSVGPERDQFIDMTRPHQSVKNVGSKVQAG